MTSFHIINGALLILFSKPLYSNNDNDDDDNKDDNNNDDDGNDDDKPIPRRLCFAGTVLIMCVSNKSYDRKWC